MKCSKTKCVLLTVDVGGLEVDAGPVLHKKLDALLPHFLLANANEIEAISIATCMPKGASVMKIYHKHVP